MKDIEYINNNYCLLTLSPFFKQFGNITCLFLLYTGKKGFHMLIFQPGNRKKLEGAKKPAQGHLDTSLSKTELS